MILILFQIGADTFGLEASRVTEVVPLLASRTVPHVPGYITGIINYRGDVVPLVDLSMLHRGTPSQPFLSTRIILSGYDDEIGERRTVGLIAERVTDTFNCRREDFQPPGVRTDGIRYLGEVLLDHGRTIQLVSPERILTREVLEILHAGAGEQG